MHTLTETDVAALLDEVSPDDVWNVAARIVTLYTEHRQ